MVRSGQSHSVSEVEAWTLGHGSRDLPDTIIGEWSPAEWAVQWMTKVGMVISFAPGTRRRTLELGGPDLPEEPMEVDRVTRDELPQSILNSDSVL